MKKVDHGICCTPAISRYTSQGPRALKIHVHAQNDELVGEAEPDLRRSHACTMREKRSQGLKICAIW